MDKQTAYIVKSEMGYHTNNSLDGWTDSLLNASMYNEKEANVWAKHAEKRYDGPESAHVIKIEA